MILGAPTKEHCTRGHLLSETRKRYLNGDSYCSLCKKIRTAQERAKFPERAKIYGRRHNIRRYGIEPATYDQLLNEQEGKCKICSRFPSNRSLHIDHDHKTGEVRGLLCHGCNTALGLLGEDVTIVEKVLAYLKK